MTRLSRIVPRGCNPPRRFEGAPLCCFLLRPRLLPVPRPPPAFYFSCPRASAVPYECARRFSPHTRDDLRLAPRHSMMKRKQNASDDTPFGAYRAGGADNWPDGSLGGRARGGGSGSSSIGLPPTGGGRRGDEGASECCFKDNGRQRRRLGLSGKTGCQVPDSTAVGGKMVAPNTRIHHF